MTNHDSPIYILDSFALIGYWEDEPGAERLESILELARKRLAIVWLSIMNYGEAIYITEREKGMESAREAILAIDELPVSVVDADRAMTFAAAHIKANCALSYADAFAAALAQAKNGCVVTGDPEFKRVEHIVPVEWLAQ